MLQPDAHSDQIAPPPSLPIRDRFLRLSQVMDVVGLGKTRIYEMIKGGEFPAPCKPGGSASRWSENEVLGWIAQCASQRLH
jgi:prophage regulatory protein